MYGMVSSQSSGRKVKSMRPQYRHDHQFQQQPIDRPLYARFFQFLKQAWYGIRDYEEERDLEEFEAQQVHIKPEAIEVLCRLTKFNRKELQIMYRGFKQDCPSGLVKEDTFKIIYAQFFPRTSETNQYAHLIFRSFDPHRTGAITFTDFVIGLSKLIRGSLQDKLRWTFDMYDINQDGVITRDDLTQIVSAVYELMGKSMETIIDDQNQVDKVFRKLDLKMKGVITFNDFLESCLEDENLVRSLSVMDTIF